MSLDIYHLGFVVCALAGAAIALFCYGSQSDGPDCYTILAVTGALSGIAYWFLYMNDGLGLPKR
jgi:hypothetical protein